MGNIQVIKGSLFDAPNGSMLIHACNTKGVWGSGIAKEFKSRYPEAYKLYRLHCKTYGDTLIGTCYIIRLEHLATPIACLFTSRGYGNKVDKPELIVENTVDAVAHMIALNVTDLPMCMCKINSGKFGVPWNITEFVLKGFDEDFTVYEF